MGAVRNSRTSYLKLSPGEADHFGRGVGSLRFVKDSQNTLLSSDSGDMIDRRWRAAWTPSSARPTSETRCFTKVNKAYIIHNSLWQFCASHNKVMWDVRHLASLRQWESGLTSVDQLTSSATCAANPPQVGRKCGVRSDRDSTRSRIEIQKGMRFSTTFANVSVPIPGRDNDSKSTPVELRAGSVL